MKVGESKYDNYGRITCSIKIAELLELIKGEDVVESQRYEDHFVSRSTLVALSKSNESRDSKRMQIVANSKIGGTQIHLFVRKNKNDSRSKEFYYLGRMDFVRFLNDERPVEIEYRLREEVRADLFDYLNAE